MTPAASVLDVALVALPWPVLERPSAALGALAAFVARDEPSVRIRVEHENLRVADAISKEIYEEFSDHCYGVGELCYMALLYPERQPEVRAAVVGWAERHRIDLAGALPGFQDGGLAAAYDELSSRLEAHLDAAVERISGVDVVGLTTSFGQLFANLAFAKRLAERSPGVRIVLGGSTVSGRVGPSILSEYPFVDHIVQGEGELPFLEIVRAVRSGARVPADPGGILTRVRGALRTVGPASLREVPSLDDLPIPDFDAYAALAEEHRIDWLLPVEGSRGCWWDRTKRTGDPKATCFFCNLNVQWSGYREKSVARVVSEVDALTERYERARVFFLDNILRHRGEEALADGLASLGKDLELFYEMRANVRPHALLKLWEAGLSSTQFGIEGLSTSYLRRIGKGTTVIQNLEVMKICFELGIENGCNFIIDFPGSTEDEVAETVRNIERFALPYQPAQITGFQLGVESTLDRLRDEFGITEVRNSEIARIGLPAEVASRLQLFDLEFDPPAGSVSWDPVREAVARWSERHAAESRALLLSYRTGRDFLRIVDRRVAHEEYTLSGASRDVYLYCTEIRSREAVLRRFAGSPRAEIEDTIASLVELDLLYEENGKLLALAVAATPQAAARRIRAMADSRGRREADEAQAARVS